MTFRSLAKRKWYSFIRLLCQITAVVAFRVRVYDRQQVPAEGGALILSNHQSHLDPALVGLSCNRQLSCLARDTLFRFAPFRWLILSINAIPIDREGMGLSGIKETLRRIKRGEIVLLFPEGTRSRDGEISRLQPGFCALARRGRVPLVPVAIAGAYEAWPRRRPFPRPAIVTLQFGQPLSPDEVASLDDEALVAAVEARLRECLQRARMRRR